MSVPAEAHNGHVVLLEWTCASVHPGQMRDHQGLPATAALERPCKFVKSLLNVCMSSLREGHANHLCAAAISTDVIEVTVQCLPASLFFFAPVPLPAASPAAWPSEPLPWRPLQRGCRS